MFGSNCGNEITDNTKVCSECGHNLTKKEKICTSCSLDFITRYTAVAVAED